MNILLATLCNIFLLVTNVKANAGIIGIIRFSKKYFSVHYSYDF